MIDKLFSASRFLLVGVFFALYINEGKGQSTHTFEGTFIVKEDPLTMYVRNDKFSQASAYYARASTMDSLDLIPRSNPEWHDQAGWISPYKLADYAHSGYDWGHLTPYKILGWSVWASRASYNKWNQAPQLSFFNEHPWEQSEMAINRAVKSFGDCDIITVVIYSKQPLKIGKDSILVPDYYAKVCWFKNKGMVGILGDNKTGEIIYATVDQIEAKFKELQGIEVDLYATVRQPQSALLESRNVDIDIIGKKK